MTMVKEIEAENRDIYPVKDVQVEKVSSEIVGKANKLIIDAGASNDIRATIPKIQRQFSLNEGILHIDAGELQFIDDLAALKKSVEQDKMNYDNLHSKNEERLNAFDEFQTTSQQKLKSFEDQQATFENQQLVLQSSINELQKALQL